MSREYRRHRRTAGRILVVGVAVAVGTIVPTAPSSAQLPQVHPTGVVIPADTPTVAPEVLSASELAALPASVDLRAWAVPPGNQGSVGSCVAWAIDYSMLGWYSRRTGHAGQPFAPMFDYHLLTGGKDQGSFSSLALELTMHVGADTRAHYKHSDSDYKSAPTNADRESAARHRIAGYQELFFGVDLDTVGPIKKALAAGKPVAIMLGVRPGFDRLGSDPNAVDNDTTGEVRGNHAVLAVAYDSAGLIVENSWGTSWANKGFGRISWNVVRKDVFAADTMSGFDQDERTVFRPSDGTWYFRASGTTKQFGEAGDIPVPADYDGDGFAGAAFWRPSDGTWHTKNGVVQWGQPGDIPVPADYNGSGKAQFAVFRPSNGTWYIYKGAIVQYGQHGDIPLPGDYNGSGNAQLAVFRPFNGTWYVRGQRNKQYGQSGDIPVPADYSGVGRVTRAVFRPANGTWYVLGQKNVQYGQRGDIPVPGDFFATGKADRAVFRPSSGTWYTYGRPSYEYGTAGDIPVARRYT